MKLEQCTYSWTKSVALVYELDEKVDVFVRHGLLDIVWFISGLFKPSPNDLAGTFVMP
jgi:hypothetical protein